MVSKLNISAVNHQPVFDFNSIDFMSEAMSLSVEDAVDLLYRDDLKCTNEDQIADFVVEYLHEN